MIKERIKSVILVMLVIFTFVLAERILVDKKLWPLGYNFFNFGFFEKDNSSVSADLTTPERIIVNTGYQSSRYEYLSNSAEFKEIYSESSNILKTAFSKPAREISEISSESWYSALTGKSVYICYPTTFSAQNFAGLMGIRRTEAPFKGFSDIVIDENGTLYVNDDDSFYKIETSSGNMADIIENSLEKDIENQSVIDYSFDLNFDKEFGSQKTILSPMIPIYSGSVEADVIVAENPLLKDGILNQKAISSILSAFSINPNSMWRYTEADGTLVFVENTGVLKISTDGILTFTASDMGISLSNQGPSTAYETLSEVTRFINTVNTSIDQQAQMSLTSPLTQTGAHKFTFDYTICGIPVKYSGKNAVSVTAINGYITEYSQVLRCYTPSGYKEFSPLYIEALDNIIAKYQDSMNQINIKKMSPAYIDNLENGEKIPDWYIEIDNVVAE